MAVKSQVAESETWYAAPPQGQRSCPPPLNGTPTSSLGTEAFTVRVQNAHRPWRPSPGTPLPLRRACAAPRARRGCRGGEEKLSPRGQVARRHARVLPRAPGSLLAANSVPELDDVRNEQKRVRSSSRAAAPAQPTRLRKTHRSCLPRGAPGCARALEPRRPPTPPRSVLPPCPLPLARRRRGVCANAKSGERRPSPRRGLRAPAAPVSHGGSVHARPAPRGAAPRWPPRPAARPPGPPTPVPAAGAAPPRLALPGAPEGRPGGGCPARGGVGGGPRGPTHIRSGTSRRPSTIMSGRKSSLKAEVMVAARGGGRASERPRAARRAGTGARGLPAAAAPAALVTFSPRPRSANPRRSPAPGPRAAERQVRRAGAELGARAPPLNPCGPGLPGSPARPGWASVQRRAPRPRAPPHAAPPPRRARRPPREARKRGWAGSGPCRAYASFRSA